MNPHIHILVGPTGAGKTTAARRLAEGRRAIVFSIDEWMRTLFAADIKPADGFAAIAARTARARAQMALVALQALAAGCDAIFDAGLLTRADRAEALEMALDLARDPGARFTFHVLDAPADERWARIDRRNREQGETFAFPVSRAMFDLVETLWEAPDAAERAQPFYATAATWTAAPFADKSGPS